MKTLLNDKETQDLRNSRCARSTSQRAPHLQGQRPAPQPYRGRNASMAGSSRRPQGVAPHLSQFQ